MSRCVIFDTTGRFVPSLQMSKLALLRLTFQHRFGLHCDRCPLPGSQMPSAPVLRDDPLDRPDTVLFPLGEDGLDLGLEILVAVFGGCCAPLIHNAQSVGSLVAVFVAVRFGF